MTSSSLGRTALALTACVLLSMPAAAQTTFATITGTVSDPTGAGVPAASIEAVQVETNYRYTATANGAGLYTLSQLREGTYTLKTRAPGFKEAVISGIELVSRDLRRLDVTLEVGSLETAIEVTAGATLIETETARISDTKTARDLKSLPMNTRGLWGFLALTPGVGEASTVSATRRFAGSRRNQSDAAVDGISITASNGTQISPLVQYIESFQEVRVDMANNTAESGTVGMVTVVSKSGTNRLHGSLFDYYVTPLFRARDPFQSERPTGVSHNPGGSIGGPVLFPKLYDGRNRTFFFTSFETSRGSSQQDALRPTVPIETWRRGDFSGLLPGTAIKDPTTGSPFPGNKIPENRLNPVSTKIQNRFYPLPNYGNPNVLSAQNYRELKVRGFDPNTYFTVRGDHRFSDKTFMFGRFTWQRSQSLQYTGGLPTIGQQWRQRNTRALTLSFSRMITPALLNEARWGLSFTNEPRWGPLRGLDSVRDLGLTGLVPNLPDIPGVFNMGFTGLSVTGITQQVLSDPAFYNLNNYVQDHLSWMRGRHTIKAGFMLTHAKGGDTTASNDLFGNVTFSNRYTGHPYADFLLGIPTTLRRANAPLDDMRTRWAYDLFVTDEFKATPKLTLSFGLRYELHPAWKATSGLQALFDVAAGKVVVADGALTKVSKILPAGYVDIVEARDAGLSGRTLLSTDRNNFAPRLSLAYRPWGQNTVLRAGFGIFYDLVSSSSSTNASPFVVNEPAYTNPAANYLVLPVVYPSISPALSTFGLPGAIRTDLLTPYSMQYNVTIERQQWDTGFRISYIGTNTRQGQFGYNINQPVADTRLYVDKPRAFPKYGSINYTSNGAGHQYHSFNLEVQRRFARGFLYDFNFVWARDIGDLERDQSAESAYDRRRERGVWEDIPARKYSADFVWELPFGKGRKYLSGSRAWNLVAGGWEVSSVLGANSGRFLTPLWSGQDPTGTVYVTSRTPGQLNNVRPNILRDPNLASGQRTVDRWFDVAAFAPLSPGAFGTSAKGVIKGPGAWAMHCGIAKHVDLGERARLRWEMSATNVTNHPNWSNPGLSLSSPQAFGVITEAGGASGLDESGPRRLRTALRLEW